ncbi:hypothetical protein AwMethylo_13470 [Methylobacterium sp.]|nr:hypothetical protein AwMethylo_13470 [Methylobacterium sp.]
MFLKRSIRRVGAAIDREEPVLDVLDLDFDLAAAILFRNAEWVVTADGLEHRDTGYDIPREAIDRRRGPELWDWPLHMAEKGWCTPSLFREAFLVALERYGIARDAALAESFALGFGIRASRSEGEAAFARLGEILRPRTRARERVAVAPTRRLAAQVAARV